MGVRDIDDGREIGTLLALLHARRIDEAIGAALKVASSTGSTSDPQVFVEPVIQLLEAVKMDWEAIFVGAVADASLEGWGFGNKYPLLDALAEFGSERAALLIIELAHLGKEEQRAVYVDAFKNWVQPNETVVACEGREIERSYTGHERERKAPVTPLMHKAALRATKELLTANCSKSLASAVLNVFSRSLSPDAVPSLRILAEHRSVDVAEKAERLLCALGVPIRGKGASSSAAPVRFRILFNGEPIPKDQRIDWLVQLSNSSVGSITEVKEEGIVELEREPFSSGRATNLRLRSYGGGESEPLRFAVDVSPPSDLDAITEVKVEAGRLEIRLKNIERLNGSPPQLAKIYLSETDSTYRDVSHDFSQAREVSAHGPIILSNIQNGTYNVTIWVPGAEVWSGEMKVSPGEAPSEVFLKPGSDLIFKLITPDGQRTYGARLLKNGKGAEETFDYRKSIYRALACGDYILHTFGSDEFSNRGEVKVVRGPDEVPFRGRDIPVSIQPGSPSVVDLGEIRLEPNTP